MKNKTKYIFFALGLILLNIDPALAATRKCISCGGAELPSALPSFSRALITAVQVLVPVIMIIMGIVTLVKAMISGEDKAFNSAKTNLVRKVIAGVMILLVITIVKFVFSLFGGDAKSSLSCVACFTSDENACAQVACSERNMGNTPSDSEVGPNPGNSGSGSSSDAACNTLGISSCSSRSDCEWDGSTRTCKSKTGSSSTPTGECNTLGISSCSSRSDCEWDGSTRTCKKKGDDVTSTDEDTETTKKGPTSIKPTTPGTEGVIKIVYLDPTDLTKYCDASNSMSIINVGPHFGTPATSGCMKWYAYKDDGTNYTMILDHNTTDKNPRTGNGTRDDTFDDVRDALKRDTITWNISVINIISEPEIAEITGALYETFHHHNVYDGETGRPSINHVESWYYLNGSDGTDPDWQTKVAGINKYAWLFDYTDDCVKNGCNIAYPHAIGYFTKSKYTESKYKDDSPDFVFYVTNEGIVDVLPHYYSYGIRPVITVPKNIISE